MRTLFYLTTLFGLLLNCTVLSASEVYKKIDKDGRVIYSDSPSENAEVIQLQPLKTFSSPPIPKETTTIQANTVAPVSAPIPNYQVMIVSPDPDSFIPVGQITQLEVKVLVNPALTPNAQLQLMLDGQPYGSPQTTNTFVLNKSLSNGNHTLQVRVINANNLNKIYAESPSITIHTKNSFLGNSTLPPSQQMPKAPQAPLAPRAP